MSEATDPTVTKAPPFRRRIGFAIPAAWTTPQ